MTRSLVAALIATSLLAACSSDDEPAAPQPTACDAYCSAVATSCGAAADAPYGGLTGDCLTACNTRAAWPAGTAGATSGNSLACRATHAGLASSNPGVHCPHAGPTGGGVCGGYCENYCYLALRNCTGTNQLYADDAACQAACAGLATTGAANSSSLNTVQCRINHLVAAGGNPGVHCPHGAAASSTCVQ